MTWVKRPLRELVAEPLRNGRSVKDRTGGFPVLRLTALNGLRADLDQAKEGDWGREEAAPFLVRGGDFLVSRGNGSLHRVAKGSLVGPDPVEVAFPDTMIRVRPNPAVLLPTFLAFAWSAPAVRTQIESRARTTAGIYKVSQKDLSAVTLPAPEVSEQRQVVEILEGHLSHLNAANLSIIGAEHRRKALVKSILVDLIPDREGWPLHWEHSMVGAVGRVELGRQRHPDWHVGPNMRAYLRVANVFENRIDTSDVMKMHWPGDTFERFRLNTGDILLNEGQTPALLGRPAMYRGDPLEAAFTNSLIRFVAGPDVLADFALLVFRRHMHAGRFKRESRITTNIAHLSATRLKSVEFPVPPLEEQRRIVQVAEARLSAVSVLANEVRIISGRAEVLLKSVLTAAFEGKLTGRHADSEVIEELAGA